MDPIDQAILSYAVVPGYPNVFLCGCFDGPEPFALAPRADILNRFLISRLLALRAITYVPGKIANLLPEGTGFRATLDSGATLEVDDVKVRHGTVPSLKAAYPEVWEKYHPARMALPHLTPEPFWPNGYFSG